MADAGRISGGRPHLRCTGHRPNTAQPHHRPGATLQRGDVAADRAPYSKTVDSHYTTDAGGTLPRTRHTPTYDRGPVHHHPHTQHLDNSIHHYDTHTLRASHQPAPTGSPLAEAENPQAAPDTGRAQSRPGRCSSTPTTATTVHTTRQQRRGSATAHTVKQPTRARADTTHTVKQPTRARADTASTQRYPTGPLGWQNPPPEPKRGERTSHGAQLHGSTDPWYHQVRDKRDFRGHYPSPSPAPAPDTPGGTTPH